MQKPFKILMLEHSKEDAEIVQQTLIKAKPCCEFKIVTAKKDYLEALDSFQPDLILSNNSLPKFNASQALEIFNQRSLPIPFILVTGVASEEFAASIIKLGADDYILKDRLSRLPGAIDAALKQRKAARELNDYKFALDQSSIISITDQFGIIQYVNENFCNISKYTADELIGQDHRIINSGYHPESYIRSLWTTIINGHIWRGELRNKAKDGSIYWVDATIIPFLDAAGKPYQHIAIRSDITEKKKVEQELLQSQMRLNQSQEIAHLGNWEVNFETNVSKWSDEAYRIYGITPGDHGLSVEEWISFIHPDDLEYVHQIIESSRATLCDQAFYHRIVRKDGVVRYVYSESKYEFNNKGIPVGLYGIAQDVTENKKAQDNLRHSEERLNEAQAIAHIGNWEIDLVHNIHSWSDELYRIYGFGKNEVMPSIELFLSCIHPGERTIAQKMIDETFKTFSSSKTNFRFIHKDGKTRYAAIEWRFEFDHNENPVRLFGILQDITDRKVAEENLLLLEKKILEQKIQEQKKISRAIIKAQEAEKNHIGMELHDNINQLLAGVMIYLGMAARKNKSINELLKYPMELLANSMQEIRLLSHRQATPLNHPDLAALISRLIKNLEQNTSIKTTFIYTVPGKFIRDELKLNIYRIIQELLNNILKHADAKNVSIAIKEKDKIIHIVVTDDGKGFKVKGKRKGIGISNMINRVESYNGKLQIKSSLGMGCKTNITIPH